MDIVKLLATNAGPIVAGLIGSVATLMGVLITRGTMRGSSRAQRTDDYRREVRSAASSVVRATRTFIDAMRAFEGSIFWIKDAVHSTPGHDERYLACKKAKAELNEKIADFELLIDIDMLSKAVLMVNTNSTMADCAAFNVSFDSRWPGYTEAQLEDELKQISKYRENLERRVLPKFLESVKKYVSHTIVEEKRRRKRLLRLFTASWRWLIKQHRKNLRPSQPTLQPPAEISPPPTHENVMSAAGEHAAT